jgi:hypothetical protein
MGRGGVCVEKGQVGEKNQGRSREWQGGKRVRVIGCEVVGGADKA